VNGPWCHCWRRSPDMPVESVAELLHSSAAHATGAAEEAGACRVGRALRQFGVERRIVAQQLHLSTHTVKTHLHDAAKLGMTSRAQLV
jgi:DNA-binding NarL/FixJ family response regulator